MLLLAFANLLSAQQARPRTARTRYKLIDLGTLGGPVSYGGPEGIAVLNNAGVIASSADTPTPDPNAPDFCFNPECFVTHAVLWKNGTLTDLGALPGINSSAAQAINAQGWSAGYSQNGLIDPVMGMPEWRAVFWKRNMLHELGTLGGEESLANAITNTGEVIGMATTNTIFDPYAFFGAPTHPFIWNGQMKDLGTLGGPDAFLTGACVNPELVVGGSFINDVPNDNTQLPTLEPFLWDDAEMIDLGTFGGTFGFAQCGNHLGQIIGQSDLPGDLTFHPFLWEKGVLRDLGTLGGDNGTAVWINDRGDVVGEADISGNQASHAFLWRKGVMTDLGTLDGNSRAKAVNSRTQVVGHYFITGRAEPPFRHPFLWEEGGPMVDLNDLIPSGSSLELVDALDINERGEIMGVGVPDRCFPDFCGHTYLLVPCGSDDVQGCEMGVEENNAAIGSLAKRTTENSALSHQRPVTARERVSAWLEQIRETVSRSSQRSVTPLSAR
jgi:probable HAF family extracellular repeat protein